MLEWKREKAEPFLKTVLASGETQQLETKRVSGKMVGKALETVCAFANTRGGWLVLGVDDTTKAKEWDRLYGIDENREAVDELLRKLNTHLLPAVEGITAVRIPCTLRNGMDGTVMALHVPASDKVHSILDDGTWSRGEASNREMNASEITELSYRRGVKSAESEPVSVDFDLLDTDAWRLFLQGRGLLSGDLRDRLYRLGLAKRVGNELQPVRAAVLLFADEPGALLAGIGSRADIRVFHYRGNVVEEGEVPNLKKPPKTISGPLYRQIAQAHAYLLEELAAGLTLAASGFRTVHRYPERVIKEAITNAVIHRDYRLNRDIQIRIFDNRIEVFSPGLFPGRITPANIHRAGSFARNPLIARNLREFSEPPNVDAGEGVRMMFNLMRANNLYPPVYRELREQAPESVSVTLLNEERPPIWEQVSDWIDRNGPIGNADLCQIAGVDTLRASKMLKRWVDQGVLEQVEGRAKRNMAYRKPTQTETGRQPDLLSDTEDNNDDIA
ncbi:ATP-binding protein [Methylocaldum sp. RMAD-M]|jgi:ATP-dependent DNA helicase RecG|uniref:ATP-binding protein n=1 Tax=Methylocaldum sp. RMAD-M TaxID=2806557 RepID=UPI00197C9701|nr:ATP-binding protein [Methylocaldum sp. RMAD-M]MBP1149213.1 ATP-dependent DNA helicase RecG [Methylocaldum sp. RMAD-M]